jgi:hypothetical protein
MFTFLHEMRLTSFYVIMLTDEIMISLLVGTEAISPKHQHALLHTDKTFP